VHSFAASTTLEARTPKRQLGIITSLGIQATTERSRKSQANTNPYHSWSTEGAGSATAAPPTPVVRTTRSSVRRVQHQSLQSPNYMSVALCLYGREQSAMLSSSGSVYHLINRWLPVLRLIHATAQWPMRGTLRGARRNASRCEGPTPQTALLAGGLTLEGAWQRRGVVTVALPLQLSGCRSPTILATGRLPRAVNVSESPSACQALRSKFWCIKIRNPTLQTMLRAEGCVWRSLGC
jgi:hypothetical protein